LVIRTNSVQVMHSTGQLAGGRVGERCWLPQTVQVRAKTAAA
jgi:hypothetical protein